MKGSLLCNLYSIKQTILIPTVQTIHRPQELNSKTSSGWDQSTGCWFVHFHFYSCFCCCWFNPLGWQYATRTNWRMWKWDRLKVNGTVGAPLYLFLFLLLSFSYYQGLFLFLHFVTKTNQTVYVWSGSC